MSNFLNLNGIQVPCSVSGGAKATSEDMGQSQRAVDGTWLVHRRVTKLHWAFQSTPQDDLHARAFRDLVLGRGHFWNFNANLFSSKGLGPSAIVNTVFGAGGGYNGSGGRASQSAGSSNKVQITLSDIITRGRWGVMHARQVNGGGYTHYVATYDGTTRTEYTAGVLTGSVQTWLTVNTTTGVVELDADNAHTTDLGELLILPYTLPSDWPAQMYTWNNAGNQWSQLGRLFATGTSIDGNERTATVAGQAKDLTYMPAYISGVFSENAQAFTFELQEV